MREMHDVRFAVLGASGGNSPQATGKVEFVPGQSRHLFSALTRQRQKFHNASIGTIDLTGRSYDPSKFLVAEHTVTRLLPCRCRDSFSWRSVRNSASDTPSEEGLQHFDELIGSCRRARPTPQSMTALVDLMSCCPSSPPAQPESRLTASGHMFTMKSSTRLPVAPREPAASLSRDPALQCGRRISSRPLHEPGAE